MPGDIIPEGEESVEDLVNRLYDEVVEHAASNGNNYTITEAFYLKAVIDRLGAVRNMYHQERGEG